MRFDHSILLDDGVLMQNTPIITRTETPVTFFYPVTILARGFTWVCFLLACKCQITHAQTSNDDTLAANLLFHASFDQSTTADFAKGSPILYEASSIAARSNSEPISSESETAKLKAEGGRFAGCIQFEGTTKNMVFYQVHNNFPNPSEIGEGTVSFWLKTDPESELREGFCDPIQVTSKQWDDAAFFVEFEKKRGQRTPFRLGVYADKQVWNPQGTDFASIPPDKRPLASVDQPPFQKGKWIHVTFTFSNFNNNKTDGTSDLYLDGSLVASLSPRLQTFTWDIEQAAMMLGLNYVGSMDDLAIFNRALTAKEVESLHKLTGGVRDLKPKQNQ